MFKATFVMFICNVLMIFIARPGIKKRNVGPKLPFANLTLPELLGTTSLGHILGAGAIIGLRSGGII